MKPAIISKIGNELKSGVDSEKSVLYLLAEIRKLLDQCSKSERRQYPNLYFYCNWVLHVELDRTPAKDILNRFESHILNTNSLKEIANVIKKQEKDFYSFENLKKELRMFVNKYGLSDDLVEKGIKWFKFKKLLVEILIDCPLINKGGRISRFSYEKGKDEQIRFRVDVNEIKKLGSFKITLKEK